jgi:glyoxylase-like metal-dependent hydrolase (beta-lactamase superfamily II)
MAHNVYHQPTSDQEIDEARAALSACPVAAIRVETSAHRHHNDLPPMSQRDLQLTKELAISPKFNGRPVPFPRPLTVAKALTNGGGEDEEDDDDDDDSSNGNDETNSRVWFVGHHNEASFGATPYIFFSQQDDKWIMVDTPRFSKSTVRAVDSLAKGRPVDYLILTHVDDTPGHNDWKDYYPNLQRVFHAGDTGRHNWVGDATLEHVEVLLNANGKDEDYDCGGDGDGEPTLPAFDIHGNKLTTAEACQKQVVIYHTPGHSPGSISILFRNDQVNGGGVLFTGDTYAYRLSSGQMTGFPRYGNDRQKQAQILSALLDLDWTVIAPGHGHYRDYSMISNKDKRRKVQRSEMESAIKELQQYGVALRRPQ